jgi:hypothetical protein
MSYRQLAWLLPWSLCAAYAVACSATGDGQSFDETSGAGASGTTGSTSTGQGGDDLTTVGSGGGTPTAGGCSADLQDRLDVNGVVIEHCPADQGCFEGVCIPACEAAAKSQGSIGCEYLATTPPFIENEAFGSLLDGPCFAVFVANTWGRDAKLSLRYGAQTLDAAPYARIPSGIGASTVYSPLPAAGLPPGEVAVLFLSHKPGSAHPIGTSLQCPVAPAILQDTAVHASGRGQSFEVTSDTPITAYSILPYGGSVSYLPSASLLHPRTAWGTNYVASSPHPQISGQLWLTLVGREDGTTVTLLPGNTLPGGSNVPTAPVNVATTVTLGAGEVVQWLGADPTGTIVQSDKPVGAWAGSTYLYVSTATSPSGGGQDSAHQELLPVNALGNRYVGGGLVTRRASLQPESVLYRLVGVVDGTSLSWDPAPPSGAPLALAPGQVAEFESSTYFSVASQDADHPFSAFQYMGGANDMDRPGCSPSPPVAGIPCGLGDEEWVTLLPPAQFLSRYVFFTDPTYATTNLVLTRVKGPTGFHDVSVECLGTVSGFAPVGASGEFEVAHVDLYRAGVGVVPACATSRHLATSEGSFGVTVWGTDYYASYAYPAGGNLGTINEVVVPPEPK